MDPASIKALLEALTANPQDPEAIKAAATAVLASLAGAGGSDSMPPPGDPVTESAEPTPPAPGTPPAPDPKSPSKLAKALGFTNDDDAATEIVRLRARVNDHDATAAAVELGARRDLVATLIKLGVETPADAWVGSDDAERAKRVPVKRLSVEPIAEMRARVDRLRASRPELAEGERPPREVLTVDVTKLSKVEREALKKSGMSPEEFAQRKADAVRRIG